MQLLSISKTVLQKLLNDQPADPDAAPSESDSENSSITSYRPHLGPTSRLGHHILGIRHNDLLHHVRRLHVVLASKHGRRTLGIRLREHLKTSRIPRLGPAPQTRTPHRRNQAQSVRSQVALLAHVLLLHVQHFDISSCCQRGASRA